MTAPAAMKQIHAGETLFDSGDRTCPTQAAWRPACTQITRLQSPLDKSSGQRHTLLKVDGLSVRENVS